MEDIAAGTAVHRPGVGSSVHLEVGAGVVGQVAAVIVDGNTAGDGFDIPDGQITAGDHSAVHSDRHGSKLAAGQGSAHGLISTTVVGNDHKLTAGGDLGRISHQHEAGVGDGVVGIICTTDGTAAVGVAVTGRCNTLGVAVAALGAGVGLHTGGSAGCSSGDLGSIAVAANRLCHTTDGTHTAGVAVGTSLTAGITDTFGVVKMLAGAGGLGVLQSQSTVAVLGQGKGNLNAAGNVQFFSTALYQCTGGVGAVGLCHEPLTVALGLHENIAVIGKGSRQLTGRTELVRTHVGGIFLTTVVGTVDEADQVVGLVVVGIRCATDRASTLGIAVTGGCNAFGVAVAAKATGKGLDAGLGASSLGGHLGGVAVTAALSANLILIQLQIGNVAAGIYIAGSVSTELAGADLVVDATAGGSRVQNVAAGAFGDRPCIGCICHLEVGAGIVAQVRAVQTDGNAAAGLFHRPHRQTGAGDQPSVDSDGNSRKLAAGKGGAHGLIRSVIVGNQQELAARGDLGNAGDQYIAGIGDGIVGIQSATDGTDTLGVAVTLGIGIIRLIAVRADRAGVGGVSLIGTGGGGDHALIAVTGGRDGLGIGIAALGAGVGLHTGIFTGSRRGDLGGIAVAAGRLCLAADGTLTAGIAVVAGHAANCTATVFPSMGTDLTALSTGVAIKAVGAGNRTGVALAVRVEQVLAGAFCHAVLQLQCAIVIFGQRKVDLNARRDICLVGVGNTGIGIVESQRLGSTLEALGHIPVGIIAGLDADIALLLKGSGELTGRRELVLAQIGSILFATVVFAVDEAEQIVLIRERTPGTAAGIPGAICHGIAVGTIGGDGQIGTLIPLVAPVVGAAVGIHPAEDHAGVSAGDITFIDAVPVGIGHTGPAFAVAIKIGREPCPLCQPIGIWLQIKHVGGGGKSRHGYHAEQHSQHQQDTEEFVHSSFHGLPPCDLDRRQNLPTGNNGYTTR